MAVIQQFLHYLPGIGESAGLSNARLPNYAGPRPDETRRWDIPPVLSPRNRAVDNLCGARVPGIPRLARYSCTCTLYSCRIVVLGECSCRYKAAFAFHSTANSHFVLSFSVSLLLSPYQSFFSGVFVKGLLTPSCLLVGLMRLTNVDSARFRAIDVGLFYFSVDIKADIRIRSIYPSANAQ